MKNIKFEALLQVWINRIESDDLRNAVAQLMEDEAFHEVRTPGSLGHHHAYEGGLLVHTLEVTQLAWYIARALPAVDRDALVAAALCHDVEKKRDYVLRGFFPGQDKPKRSLFSEKLGQEEVLWVLSDFYQKIHHVSGSYSLFDHYARLNAVDEKTRLDVGHCIVSHHGPVPGWGSVKEPQTLEATILHQADYLSAHFGVMKEKPPTDGQLLLGE